jgi:hypothetical protein
MPKLNAKGLIFFFFWQAIQQPLGTAQLQATKPQLVPLALKPQPLVPLAKPQPLVPLAKPQLQVLFFLPYFFFHSSLLMILHLTISVSLT